MEVSVDQISCGHSYVKNFWCKICKRLAAAPRVHDGGYGQLFCRQIFCSTCIDYTAFNPNAVTRIGPKGDKVYVCPSGDCLQSFVPPFFRFLSEQEEGNYAAIRIECLNCHHFFSPYQYPEHHRACGNRAAHVLPSALCNIRPLGGMSAYQIRYMIGYESRWKVRSMNFGNIVHRGGSLSTVADGVTVPIMGSSLERGYIKVVKVSDAAAMLANVAGVLSVPVDSIDVVAVVHRSLRQCGTFERFAEGLPPDAPMTIVERREDLVNPLFGGYWLFLHGYQRVPE